VKNKSMGQGRRRSRGSENQKDGKERGKRVFSHYSPICLMEGGLRGRILRSLRKRVGGGRCQVGGGQLPFLQGLLKGSEKTESLGSQERNDKGSKKKES